MYVFDFVLLRCLSLLGIPRSGEVKGDITAVLSIHSILPPSVLYITSLCALYYHPLCSIIPPSVFYIATTCALYYHHLCSILPPYVLYITNLYALDTLYYNTLCPIISILPPSALHYHPICSILQTSALNYHTRCSRCSISPPYVL